jgi:dimeric dUTPase (all-alpha-NTP-PPase superfamily)
MEIAKMFELQKELDAKIIREKGLEGKDLLPNTVLALQVELGELANEWRGFKHWSADQEPRTEKMLVEYVDCLHFILSIGLQCYYDESIPALKNKRNIYCHHCGDVISQFTKLIQIVGSFGTFEKSEGNYTRILMLFGGLGEKLGFTWEQIEQAYMDKNKINHERQANGY